MKEPQAWIKNGRPKLPRGQGSWAPFDHQNGRVCLRFENHGTPDKVYSSRSTDDAIGKRNAKIAAESARRALVTRLANGDASVSEMLDAWVVNRLGEKHAPGTHDRYQSNVRILQRQPIAAMRASDVEPHHVDQMLSSLTPVPYSLNTLKALRSHLSQAFKYGVRNKFCAMNPAAISVMPGKVRQPKEVKWLSVEEYPKMWNYLVDHWKESDANVALLVMMATAIRPGEALALSWDMIDLDEGTIKVARNMQRSDRGRIKTVVPQLKSTRSARTITLPPAAIEVLTKYRRTRPFGHLFYNHRGNLLGFDGLRWWINHACTDLEIERLTPHQLRHSTGSMLLYLGMSAEECAETLGQTQEVFNDTYRHQLRGRNESGRVLASVLTLVTG